MKNLETNRKLMANRKKYSTLRTLYVKLVSSVAEDANTTRQVHWTFEVVGPACQNISGNHHIRGQKKIAASYSDPGSTLEKITQPKTYLAATKSINFGSEGQSCRSETKPTENKYACHDVSV